MSRPDGVVELLIEDDMLVGQGFVDQTYQPGMELHYLKLTPDEVAVCVTEVFQGSLWVDEVVGERLEQCVGLVIRWNASKLRKILGSPQRNFGLQEGQQFTFPNVGISAFDFDDEGNHGIPISMSESNPVGSSVGERLLPVTPESQSSVAGLFEAEGLVEGRPQRKYSMQNRRSRPTRVRERGESVQRKVTIESVRAA
ncbi:MAG TPA: hypothetical protein VEQ18_02130 [Candidatus Nitrosocosmicus sp.]|nr:hypothetical protein [Candidatus Nitrosocosmicus sp.]